MREMISSLILYDDLCYLHAAEKHAKVPCVTVSVDDIIFNTTVR